MLLVYCTLSSIFLFSFSNLFFFMTFIIFISVLLILVNRNAKMKSSYAEVLTHSCEYVMITFIPSFFNSLTFRKVKTLLTGIREHISVIHRLYLFFKTLLLCIFYFDKCQLWLYCNVGLDFVCCRVCIIHSFRYYF